MHFNAKTIKAKIDRLDLILKEKQILETVLSKLANNCEVTYQNVPRPWNPGGGSTLFRVQFSGRDFFLKVKHLSVTVESKLEGELAYSNKSSLRNEYDYLKRYKPLSLNVPQTFLYTESDGFGFLLVESLSPFSEVVGGLTPVELVETYNQIEAVAKMMFTRGSVHTDIHELNVMFRGRTPVLIDFEEARDLNQDCDFARSLDCIGQNQLGNVGEMPLGEGRIPGLTCLARLRDVIERHIRTRLPDLLRECKFDSSCPFLKALDHGKDERIYQSIDLDGIKVSGQRPLNDNRISNILALIGQHFDRPITHLDIGSNLGRFDLELSRSEKVTRSVGVEAFEPYVRLARVLAFLDDNDKVQFLCAECGTDSLTDLLAGQKVDCVTIYSVYHHISNKEAFLNDIRRLDPELILLEMPVQPECYEGRTWQEEMNHICNRLGRRGWELVAHSADYHRPIVVVKKPRVRFTQGDDGAARPFRVSVVLPTYNHFRYLPHAIESVLAQTYKDFELIIVNDGSTDGTRDYLETIRDPRVKVIHQANQRLPSALNAGFQLARGEVLTWTSSDNYCAPIFLEALVGALDAHPDAGMAIGAFAFVNTVGQIRSVHRVTDLSVPAFFTHNPGVAAFLYRRQCLETVGQYAPELNGAEDWDMWLRIAERYPVVAVPELIYYYREHEDSMTARIPDQVAVATRRVINRAMDRRNGSIDLEELYPAIGDCVDRELATTHAAMDFGTRLLRSHVAPPELAARFLAIAFERKSIPEIAANLMVAFARCGDRGSTVKLAEHLRTQTNKQIRALLNLAESETNPASLALRRAPLFMLDAKSELLSHVSHRQRVFSITASPSKEGNASASLRNRAEAKRRPPVAGIPDDSLTAQTCMPGAGKLNNHGALRAQAHDYFAQAKWAETAALCATVISKAPDDPEILFIFAHALANLGEILDAITIAQRLVALRPREREYSNLVGMLEEAMAGSSSSKQASDSPVGSSLHALSVGPTAPIGESCSATVSAPSPESP